MKAVVKYKSGENHIEFREVKKPKPKENEVLIAVAYAGICGTDLKIKKGEYSCAPPVILGHEYSGTVVAVGRKVTGVNIGDKVTSETVQIVCGKCGYCLSGSFLMCEQRKSIGYGTNGAMGEYIVVREEIVHKIPESLSLDEAALCEPAAVAYHAVFDYANVKPDDEVLVVGPGTIGQFVAQLLISVGCNVCLCGTEKDGYRLNVAEKFGAKTFVCRTDSISSTNEELVPGKVFDFIFECSGSPDVLTGILKNLKKRGVLIQIGLMSRLAEVEYGLISMKELAVKGAFGHIHSSWIGVLKLFRDKKIQAAPLISGKYSFAEWEKGFDEAQKLSAIKILLHP